MPIIQHYNYYYKMHQSPKYSSNRESPLLFPSNSLTLLWHVNLFSCWTAATRENQLGTNTNLLTTMKSVFLASLSIHIMACCWFAVSCENQVSYTPSGVKPLCKRGSWAHSSKDKLYILLKYFWTKPRAEFYNTEEVQRRLTKLIFRRNNFT